MSYNDDQKGSMEGEHTSRENTPAKEQPRIPLLLPEDDLQSPIKSQLHLMDDIRGSIYLQTIEELPHETAPSGSGFFDEFRNSIRLENIKKLIFRPTVITNATKTTSNMKEIEPGCRQPDSALPLPSKPPLLVSSSTPNTTNPACIIDNQEDDILAPVEVPLLPSHVLGSQVGHPNDCHHLSELTSLLRNAIKLPEHQHQSMDEQEALQKCDALWSLVAIKLSSSTDGRDDYITLPPTTTSMTGIECAIHALSMEPRHLESMTSIALDECSISATSSNTTNTALDIYLDWSLTTSQPSLRSLNVVNMCKKVNEEVLAMVRPTPVPRPQLMDVTQFSATYTLKSMLRPFSVDVYDTNETIRVIEDDLTVQKEEEKEVEVDGRLPFTTTPTETVVTTQHVIADDGKLSATKTLLGAAAVERRDFNITKKQTTTTTAVVTNKMSSDGDQGMLGFYVNLQQQQLKKHQQQKQAMATEEDEEDCLSDFLPKLSSMATVAISLPPDHTALFNSLSQANTTVCSLCPESSAFPPFPQSTHHPPNITSPRPSWMQCSIVLRETANALLHHGIQCAYLYYEEAVKGVRREHEVVKGAVEPVGRHLSRVMAQVERGQLEDHPKHTALRNELITLATLQPGIKVMVIGDPSSFFTLYSVIMTAGMRPFHFDKDRTLLGCTGTASPTPSALQHHMATAVSHSDCILLNSEAVASHMPLLELSFSFFRHIVVYVTEQPWHQCVCNAIHAQGTQIQPSVSVFQLQPVDCIRPFNQGRGTAVSSSRLTDVHHPAGPLPLPKEPDVCGGDACVERRKKHDLSTSMECYEEQEEENDDERQGGWHRPSRQNDPVPPSYPHARNTSAPVHVYNTYVMPPTDTHPVSRYQQQQQQQQQPLAHYYQQQHRDHHPGTIPSMPQYAGMDNIDPYDGYMYAPPPPPFPPLRRRYIAATPPPPPPPPQPLPLPPTRPLADGYAYSYEDDEDEVQEIMNSIEMQAWTGEKQQRYERALDVHHHPTPLEGGYAPTRPYNGTYTTPPPPPTNDAPRFLSALPPHERHQQPPQQHNFVGAALARNQYHAPQSHYIVTSPSTATETTTTTTANTSLLGLLEWRPGMSYQQRRWGAGRASLFQLPTLQHHQQSQRKGGKKGSTAAATATTKKNKRTVFKFSSRTANRQW